MATRTGQITYTGTYYKGGQGKWMSLGIQMNAQEYPTKIEIKGMNSSNGWQNTTDSSIQPYVYLCDASDGGTTSVIRHSWISANDKPRGEAWTTFEIDEEDQKNYKGKSLGILVGTGYGQYLAFRGTATVEVTTKTDEYSITVGSASHGSMTADKAVATPGETVTLTPLPDTGYRCTGYAYQPPELVVHGYTFTMPEADVTVTPAFVLINYDITASATPAAGGSISVQETGTYGETVSVTVTAETGYHFSAWGPGTNVTITNGSFTMPAENVTIAAVFEPNTYTISKAVSPSGAGTITAPSQMKYGESRAISQTPATGYQFSSWSVTGSGSIDGDTFTMGAGNATIVANYSKIAYTITKQTNKPGAGTITAPATANYRDIVALSQTPAEGYYFNGWTLSSGGSVDSGYFTMPAENITVTANYLHRSEARANTKTFRGGGTWSISFNSEDKAYTHRCRIVFPDKVTQSWQNIPGGQTMYAFAMQIPTSWAYEETTATEMTGGELQLETYSGETLIGTHVMSGLTYLMPEDCGPEISTPIILRTTTVGSVSFGDAGDYVQNHSGVQVMVVSESNYRASVASVRIRLSGYQGPDYDQTFTTFRNHGCTFTSGILTNPGVTTIEITCTDSRGLVATMTRTITVNAYEAPAITKFECWRCDTTGDPDETGEVAQFEAGYTWTQVGNNTITRSITVFGTTENVTVDTGWILPSSRQNFPALQTAEITYTVSDKLESTSVTIRLDTRRFIMHFSADGSSVAIGHAVQETPTAGSGYTGTFEIDASMEPWIGNMTLKEYILAVVNGLV